MNPFTEDDRPQPDPPNPDDLLTVVKVARIMSVETQTVRRWIRKGDLPAHRVGNSSYRIRRGDLPHKASA